MLIDGYGPPEITGEGMVECRLASLLLTPKVYDIVVFVRTANGAADLCPSRIYATFRVTDNGLGLVSMKGPYALNHLRQGSPVYVARVWQFFNETGERTHRLESRADLAATVQTQRNTNL